MRISLVFALASSRYTHSSGCSLTNIGTMRFTSILDVDESPALMARGLNGLIPVALKPMMMLPASITWSYALVSSDGHSHFFI